MLPQHYLAIDEEGFPLIGEVRITDESIAKEFLQNITKAANNAFQTELQGKLAFVEAFDEPYVAQMVSRQGPEWILQLPFGLQKSFDPDSLSLDEWDRFHGRLQNGLPFVFSRKAQAEFFDLLDDYDDESISFDGKTLQVPSWLGPGEQSLRSKEYWNERYLSEDTPWDLKQPSPALMEMLPKLKMPKSRVLVLGAGTAQDAAFFARQGHLVTLVDFSEMAIEKARAEFGDLGNLTFVQADLFHLPQTYWGQFDLVFEHTCYCAISPELRSSLVQMWRRYLAPGGGLMGVFFTMDKPDGPPFGGSEWEIRQRLRKLFQFFFWARWKHSVEGRQGKELFVFARKLESP